MSPARFHAHAVGQQGGASYRSGRTAASAELRLEGNDDWLTARGEIREGAPWLVVKLGNLVLFDGRWPIAGEEPCGCFSGWYVANVDPDTGALGDVQRCDSCGILPDENTAWQLAEAAGYVLDANGRVLRAPSDSGTEAPKAQIIDLMEALKASLVASRPAKEGT